MKRVLLTGGTGFIGRPCLQELLARGFEVHALSRKPLRDSAGAIVWHTLDLFDGAAVYKLAERLHVTHLLHLA